MTAFTVISNALVAVGAKPFATTMQALRDNVIAAFEGDATAVAAGVTLRDAALDVGAATAAGTTWVRLRNAGATEGSVGSYALLRLVTLTTYSAGQTLAGSLLRYSNVNAAAAGVPVPAGTWRLMGMTTNATAADSTSLWLRIS